MRELTLTVCGLGCGSFGSHAPPTLQQCPKQVGLVSLVCDCWSTWWQSISTWLGTPLRTAKRLEHHHRLQLAIHGDADGPGQAAAESQCC